MIESLLYISIETVLTCSFRCSSICSVYFLHMAASFSSGVFKLFRALMTCSTLLSSFLRAFSSREPRFLTEASLAAEGREVALGMLGLGCGGAGTGLTAVVGMDVAAAEGWADASAVLAGVGAETVLVEAHVVATEA